MSSALQAEIQARIDDLIASGDEIGLQVAVYHDGRLIVDAVAGVADQHTGEPVSPGTLFFAASTAKGLAASVAHVLVERGELAYDQAIADSWPGFAAHGKDGVTLADVLTHTAAVPGLWPQITPEDLCDWDRVCAFIAQQKPWWPPGTKTGYHALTFGFILGEFVRRATGRTLATVLREEIASPLGISDELHFGVPHHLLERVARAGPEGAAPPPPEPGTPLDRAIPPGVQPSAAFANRREILAADIPSQGTMNARATARMYAALLGQIEGVRLISPEHLKTTAQPAFSGRDQVMGIDTTWALGYSTARLGNHQSRPGSTFGMIGSNGTAAYADIDTSVAVAIMRNNIAGDLSVIATIDDLVTTHYS
ncbi:MAG: beta-lactamase family protein [Solirubrobacterales bacterium]|nr:beta-lactamase family protein [Solirubrobacterales bacterium]